MKQDSRLSEALAPSWIEPQALSENGIKEFGIFLIYFAPTPGSSDLAEGASMLMMDGTIPAGFAAYYNLLWRSSTLYLPAIAGLLFLAWTIIHDGRKAVCCRYRKIAA